MHVLRIVAVNNDRRLQAFGMHRLGLDRPIYVVRTTALPLTCITSRMNRVTSISTKISKDLLNLLCELQKSYYIPS